VQGDSPGKRGIPQAIRGGPIRFGPFLLEARLAVGGTAEVYLARPAQAAAPRPTGAGPPPVPPRIIVKRLLPHFLNDPEGRTMFEREAALHTAVRHENVVTVFGVGLSDNGEPYLAMEYVDGVDCYRLLRRFRSEGKIPPIPMSVHIIREVLAALSSVHGAADANGTPLGIIHRDVTPSNLYLSREGNVKLGDFGIARSTQRATMRNAASAMLKGKIAYLAPEQVAGEPFDSRADLFSVATVLAEMVLGKPLFPGAGQLAILLAIRDCKIDPLREVKDRLPEGLFEVLERALSRDPQMRFPTADAFAAALEPYDRERMATQKELANQVRLAQAAPSSDAIAAVRESARAMRAMRASSQDPDSAEAIEPEEVSVDAAPDAGASVQEDAEEAEAPSEKQTRQYFGLPMFVQKADGTRYGPWSFAQLVEALATGAVERGDEIEYMGHARKPVDEIDELVRYLPAKTATTNQVSGPGAPDFMDDLAVTSMLDVLLKVLEHQETGVVFAEGTEDAHGEAGRKELYFRAGRLHHVSSSNASELLGEYLVRRRLLEREELDIALAVLPRYGGRMGDTLIALGLVGPVDIFRAIREQGRDRVADLFKWRRGQVSFYRGQTAPYVEFPLDLELPPLILAGLDARHPGDALLPAYQARKGARLARGPADRRGLVRGVKWPPVITAILATLAQPLTLDELLARTTGGGVTTRGDVLRVLELLVAARFVAWS